MRVPPTIRVLLVALLLVTGLAGTWRGASAAPWPYGVYSIRITGKVSGWSFSRTGTLILARTVRHSGTSNVNPVEICFASGNPWSSPSTGAIVFVSNTACVGAPAKLDIAVVRATAANNVVQARPVASLSAASVNGFNAASGITAQIYQTTFGSTAFRFAGNRVAGVIDIRGRNGGGQYASYSAQVTGVRTQAWRSGENAGRAVESAVLPSGEVGRLLCAEKIDDRTAASGKSKGKDSAKDRGTKLPCGDGPGKEPSFDLPDGIRVDNRERDSGRGSGRPERHR